MKELRVRHLGGSTVTTLHREGGMYMPFFSADGEWIGYWNIAESALRRVRIADGTVLTICSVPTRQPVRGASWTLDGTVVFSASGALWQVRQDGGEAERLTTSEAEFYLGAGDHRWPDVLPGGSAVLFSVAGDERDQPEVWVLSLETGGIAACVGRGILAHGTYQRGISSTAPGPS